MIDLDIERYLHFFIDDLAKQQQQRAARYAHTHTCTYNVRKNYASFNATLPQANFNDRPRDLPVFGRIYGI